MKTHHLKSWPASFEAIADGRKTFEVRQDDRGYEVGDTLILHKWDQTTGTYDEGEAAIEVMVTYTSSVRGPAFGLAEGFVIMGFHYIGRRVAGRSA